MACLLSAAEESELEIGGLDGVPPGGNTQHPGGANRRKQFGDLEAVIDVLPYFRDHLP